MTKPRSGSTKYRKTSTYWLGKQLWKPHSNATRTQAEVEKRLGLQQGKIASMVCQTTRGLEEFEFVQISGTAYRNGQLSDEFIFEFGLGTLVQERLLPSQIETRLAQRHEAGKIFIKGVERLRAGLFPVTENGRPKKLSNAAPAAVAAAIQAWLEDIQTRGCRVMDRRKWQSKFMAAAADGSFDGDRLGDQGVVTIDLDSLDALCLVTDGGTPYAPYQARVLPVVSASWDEEAGVWVGELGYSCTYSTDTPGGKMADPDTDPTKAEVM
ncbi:hypothetical protein [Paraburkholderia sacchari]|uniref:hypothetical protein n=1 Tax=Paraburkholderia sacchari TaxID=159450 RepID=UPI003D973805